LLEEMKNNYAGFGLPHDLSGKRVLEIGGHLRPAFPAARSQCLPDDPGRRVA
jgi:hypothetical protein